MGKFLAKRGLGLGACLQRSSLWEGGGKGGRGGGGGGQSETGGGRPVTSSTAQVSTLLR